MIVCGSVCSSTIGCSAFSFDARTKSCNLGVKDNLVIISTGLTTPVYIYSSSKCFKCIVMFKSIV